MKTFQGWVLCFDDKYWACAGAWYSNPYEARIYQTTDAAYEVMLRFKNPLIKMCPITLVIGESK